MRPDPYAWSAHPEASLPVVLLAGAYVLVARRDRPLPARVAAFAGGIALLLATALTPLESLQYHLLSMHLLQNVILAEWAPALLVFGLPPLVGARLARFAPWWAALPFWLVTYFVWHAPPLYDAALRHEPLLHLEHLSYLVAGIALWLPVAHTRLHDAAKAAYLFAAFVLASPLGLLLALLPRAIYDFYVEGGGLWGLSPLADQQLAGVTMASEQAIVFFAFFTFYFARFMREQA